MDIGFKQLRVIVLKNPYDSWGDPTTENLFKDMIGVKLRGYRREYAYGVLPVDGADLISTHLILCRTLNNSYHPIMGMRWTGHRSCKTYFLNFPGLSLLQQAGAQEHALALEACMKDCDRREVEIFYAGGFSIDPAERRGKEFSLFCREILTLMFVRHLAEHPGAELITGGTMRFKMDKYIHAMGCRPLVWNGEELGPIQVRHLAGENVHVMYLRNFSSEARSTADKWNRLWEERLVIDAGAAGERKAG